MTVNGRARKAAHVLLSGLGIVAAAVVVTIALLAVTSLSGCSAGAVGQAYVWSDSPAQAGPADTAAQADYRQRVRAALVRADSTFRAERGLAVAPVPADQVAKLAGEVRLEAAAAAGDSTAPAALTVVGWAALYGLRMVPIGVEIAWFEWTPPTTGAPVARYIVETVAETTSNRYPFTILAGDTATARMRVAGEDSLARQGAFSLWGWW